MNSLPAGGQSPTWAVARDNVGAMSNEAMVHEMLYSPGWQLPATDLEEGWELAKATADQDEPLKSLPELNLQELQVKRNTELNYALSSANHRYLTGNWVPLSMYAFRILTCTPGIRS
eukprot:scaffold88767_cov47-Prasinocladus_malaysianus.AAC.3